MGILLSFLEVFMKMITHFIICVLLLTIYPSIGKGEEAMKEKKTTIVMETTQGIVEIDLWPDVAPKACDNFIQLVEKKYYDGLIFHRVIKNFMIQGGDPTGTGAGGSSVWGKNFSDECAPQVKFDKPGLLAMANRGPNTNGSQFFITTVSTPWLNMRHTIFGQVVKGMEIIAKIENSPCGPQDRPIETQKIIKAYVKK